MAGVAMFTDYVVRGFCATRASCRGGHVHAGTFLALDADLSDGFESFCEVIAGGGLGRKSPKREECNSSQDLISKVHAFTLMVAITPLRSR
jgi:hypothetical protein